jgi:hypothetical protein
MCKRVRLNLLLKQCEAVPFPGGKDRVRGTTLKRSPRGG